MSDCVFGSGDVVYRSDLPRLLSEDCVIEAGAVIRLYYADDARGEWLGSGSGEGSALVLVPRVAKRRVPHKVTTEIAMQDEVVVNGSGVPAAIPAPAPVPGPVQPIASVAAPMAAPFDVNSLVGASGGGGGIAVLLALIAVAGGAAGWKFWTKVSEQKHEQKMKELELKAAASANHDKSPQQCTTVHAALEARIAALEGKVAAVEQKSLSLGADFDAGDLDKRLDKIEKSLRLTRK